MIDEKFSVAFDNSNKRFTKQVQLSDEIDLPDQDIVAIRRTWVPMDPTCAAY